MMKCNRINNKFPLWIIYALAIYSFNCRCEWAVLPKYFNIYLIFTNQLAELLLFNGITLIILPTIVCADWKLKFTGINPLFSILFGFSFLNFRHFTLSIELFVVSQTKAQRNQTYILGRPWFHRYGP